MKILIIESNTLAAEWMVKGLTQTFAGNAEFTIQPKVPPGTLNADITFISANQLRRYGSRLRLSSVKARVVAMSNENSILREAIDQKLADRYVTKDDIYYNIIAREDYFN